MTSDYVPHSHVPYGADGSGFYTDNTIGCFLVVEQTKRLVLQALDAVPLSSLGAGAFTVCDYGTADGGISMPIINEMIEHIRKTRGSDREVSIVYEDQPINDFKSLFLRLHGLLPGPPSYLKQHSGVFCSAAGTGFYDQVTPSGTVHLAMSFTAMHWLSKRPCELSGAIHHVLSDNEIEKAAWSQQAEADWSTILLQRARELTPGGQLVVSCFCVDEEGQYLGFTSRTRKNMYERMTAHWRHLVEIGRITQEEFDATTFNNYYRTVAEYRKPFDDVTSEVYAAGLRLRSIETKVVDCPYKAKWLAEGNEDDPVSCRAHARWFLPTTRTWSNSTFLSGLSTSRPEAERAAIVDELFRLYEDEVAAQPDAHAMDYVHAYISVYKQH